jgi:hypothetical protein
MSFCIAASKAVIVAGRAIVCAAQQSVLLQCGNHFNVMENQCESVLQ